MRINDRLYSQIRGGLYHSTSVAGYQGIRRSKAILPNDGTFPFSHGQSPHSCCHKIGGVSLLDLRSPTRPLVGKDGARNWTTFLKNHKPITLLLEIDPSCLTKPLLNYDDLGSVHQYRLRMVAEAEVCHVGAISISLIRRCVLVCAECHTLYQSIAGFDVSEADIANAEAAFKAKLEKRNGHLLRDASLILG